MLIGKLIKCKVCHVTYHVTYHVTHLCRTVGVEEEVSGLGGLQRTTQFSQDLDSAICPNHRTQSM